MPNDPIGSNASVRMIKQIQLPGTGSYAALRASALATGAVNLGSTSTVITATTNLPEGLILTDGVLVLITNNVVSSASGWTLNVDQTGPKPVYSSLESSTRTSTIFKLNTSLLFRYNSTRVNGGCWDVYGYDETIEQNKVKIINYDNNESITPLDIYNSRNNGEKIDYKIIYNGDEYSLVLPPQFSYSDAQFFSINENYTNEEMYFKFLNLASDGGIVVSYRMFPYYPFFIYIVGYNDGTCTINHSFLDLLDLSTNTSANVYMVFTNNQNILISTVHTNKLITNGGDNNDTYIVNFYGISEDNKLIQINFETTNPLSTPLTGTYTMIDLDVTCSLLNDGTLYIGGVSNITPAAGVNF